jgi:hypothetical protein
MKGSVASPIKTESTPTARKPITAMAIWMVVLGLAITLRVVGLTSQSESTLEIKVGR